MARPRGIIETKPRCRRGEPKPLKTRTTPVRQRPASASARRVQISAYLTVSTALRLRSVAQERGVSVSTVASAILETLS